MTRRRFIADEASDAIAAIVGEHADHLVRVLRARIGQEFDIATSNSVRRGRISSVRKDRVEFELEEEVGPPAFPEITLLLAIFKFDRMEWAIEKCTELGVALVVPVIARRTDAHLAGAAEKRVERWQRIARQASEQARRGAAPNIGTPVPLPKILNLPRNLRIVLSEAEQKTFLVDAIHPEASAEGVTLCVGPEGGWTDDELQSFQKNEWKSASLGPTILRAETAAIAAIAIAASVLGRDGHRKS